MFSRLTRRIVDNSGSDSINDDLTIGKFQLRRKWTNENQEIDADDHLKDRKFIAIYSIEHRMSTVVEGVELFSQ